MFANKRQLQNTAPVITYIIFCKLLSEISIGISNIFVNIYQPLLE